MHRPTDPNRPGHAPGNPRPGGDAGAAPPKPATPTGEAAAYIARLVAVAPPIGPTTAERLRGLFAPHITAPAA